MEFSARRFLLNGFVFWVVIGIIAAFFAFPLRKHIKFGIDLVGGTYMTYEVKTDEAVGYELRDRLNSIPGMLKDAEKEVPVTSKIEDNNIVLTFDTDSGAQNAQMVLREEMREFKSNVDGRTLILSLTPEKINEIKKWALHSNIEVLNSRLRKIGVEEITVSSKGDKNIIVELPDVQDIVKAKEMIGTPAILEFKLVEKTGRSQEEILEEYGGQLPEGMIIVPDRFEKDRVYLVPTFADVTGRDFKDASPGFGQGANVVVNFKLTPEGGRKFRDLTGKNIGQTLAAILDGKVISAATIQSEISTQGSISGRFSIEKAKELSMLLKSGAFVARTELVEERRIGPSLGAVAIQNGLMSCLIGLALLFIFCIVVYKLLGLFAFFALLYNLLLLLFALSMLGATLTLPGIAGIVLSVGLAIDASVLIYERIRESLKAGMTIIKAIEDGFADALVVIIDANVATFIVASVLFWFGTGPIKGFAVTMMIGIVTTLIAGLFFLKALLKFVFSIKETEKLSI